MRSRKLQLLLFLILALRGLALHAQAIQIMLIDGQSGKPVPKTCVNIQTRNSNGAWLITDENGIAKFQLAQQANGESISYNRKLGCGATGASDPVLNFGDFLMPYMISNYPLCVFPKAMPDARWKQMDPVSTKQVIDHGFASTNTCGAVTVSPQPGELILFVRPRTFHEKKRDWENSDEFPF